MNKQKILIITNASDYFSPLIESLENKGVEVIIAGESFEAFRIALAESPELILVDVILPRIEGLSVCKLLKSKPVSRGIPIIVTASFLGDNVEEVANRAGADLLLERKQNSLELLDTIDNYLKKTQL